MAKAALKTKKSRSRKRVPPPPPQSAEEKARIKAALHMPDGRPSLYTEELADEVVERISRDMKPIHEMCQEEDHWPSVLTIYRWEEAHPDFRAALQIARKARADLIIDTAASETVLVKTDHKYGSNRNRQRLMLNGLAQATAQRLSRDWATKTQHEVAGPGGEDPVGVNYSNLSIEKKRELLRLQREALGSGS